MTKKSAEDANITFIDIVNYSGLPGPSQVDAIKRLTKAVKKAIKLMKPPRGRVFYLPTGDGMVVGFRGLPEQPLILAREIHRIYV